MERPSFLDQAPPAGYIPGVGRGATGFSTRGDSTGKGRVPKRLQQNKQDSHTDASATDAVTREALEKEDVEAEEVFAAIETKLSARKRAQKSTSKDTVDGIPQQFADLKRSLATVTDEEWLNLPDAGDITKKHKRERLQDQMNRKEYAAPDTLMSSNVNLSKLTEEREKLLARQLDANMLNGLERDETAARTNVGAYLTELEKSTVTNLETAGQLEDLKRMRAILASYRKSDPTRPEGWIASARLEEKAHKFRTARNIIEDACRQCPRSDEIWLERTRLNSSDIALCKTLTAEGLAFNPHSLQLWLKAAELESESFNKRRVIMKALQELPNSEELWKLVLQSENDQTERRRILCKAVELIPQSMDLWADLVETQDFVNAKKSLNMARKQLPKEPRVWILAAQIEARFNKEVSIERLKKLLTNGMSQLSKNGSNTDLSLWLHQAQSLDSILDSQNVAVAIVEAALDREDIQTGELSTLSIVNGMADSLAKIAAYRTLLQKSPVKYSIWKALRITCEKADSMEKLYRTYNQLLFDQDTGFKLLKGNPVLALMYSKEIWKNAQDTPKALDILDKSINVLPNYVDFWIAKLKVLCLSSQFDSAKATFLKAIESLSEIEVPNLDRLYLKYVSFLRFQNENQKAIEFLEQQCFNKFPECYKFYIQMGQIYQHLKQPQRMRDTYSVGTKTLPHCAILWVLLAKADEIDFKKPTKARSELDIALLKNPDQESLYLAKIQMEARLGFHDQARLIVQQALQKFPSSPKLWSENVRLLPPKRASMKKTVFQDALKKTSNCCEVLVEIGLTFYRDSQFVTALKWFERAYKSNPKHGDAWVWAARCTKSLKKDLTPLFRQVEEQEPVYGRSWISIAKNVRYQYSTPAQILGILLDDDEQKAGVNEDISN